LETGTNFSLTMNLFSNNETNNIETPTHFLYPASLIVSPTPMLVNTILGSCVAVCLWDQKIQFGGINHYMLPLWNGNGLASPKYGNIAIERLIEKMRQHGATHMSAKVFGGGEVIGTDNIDFKIGKRNIDIAMEMLKEYNIPITAQNVGGKFGRKIQFFTQSGLVKMKIIEKNENIETNEREKNKGTNS